MIEAGKLLQNRYRISRQIGQGGMGAVYVATDERFGSTVAIKETLFTDDNLRKAFEREARLLNNLRHPALPRVSDHFADENGQFIVMEYIAGEDLSEKMERGGAFSVKEVLGWADQLLDALDFLHTQEMPVIHRDIKPQNLKLTPRGQIILLDFGLAKGSGTDVPYQTAAKSVFGYSRSYASLEQIQGTGTDPRSDLYSLAATLFHLLVGMPPTDALTRAMMVLNGEADPLRAAHHVQSTVPVEVSEVLLRAMALNANHRPSSAAAMRQMLAEAREQIGSERLEAISAAPASIFTQSTKLMEPAASAGELRPAATSGGEIETLVGSFPRKDLKTNVQPAGEVTEPKGTRRVFSRSAAAFGGLLLIGGGASALYVFQDGTFRHRSEPQPETKVIYVKQQDESNSNTASPSVDANSNKIVAVNTAPETTKKERVKPAKSASPARRENDVAKVEKKAQVENEAQKPMVFNETWVFNDRIPPPAGVRVTIPEAVRKQNSFRIFSPDEVKELQELRNLTPQQREKIREAMRKHAQVAPQPPQRNTNATPAQPAKPERKFN